MHARSLSVILCTSLLCEVTAAASDVSVGGDGETCAQDPACFNRLHPEIPPAAFAAPGDTIVFRTRNAGDLRVDPDRLHSARSNPRKGLGVVHPLTGPVHIDGARAGDVLAVTIVDILPGGSGFTSASPSGFAGDLVSSDSLFVTWRLGDAYATSDAIPGVRIPNASFPGVITTLPGKRELQEYLQREKALGDAGGRVLLPDTEFAEPAHLCGAEGTRSGECLRTIPPREHGGNMDIRYMRSGTTVYLPCFIDGCGLAVGDLHYAQGDGEVAGTAIEMDGSLIATTRILRGGPDLSRGPHYRGPATNLAIPSSRYYATTGLPLKKSGEVPREVDYMASDGVSDLRNLSNDINLAARNALAAMIDHIVDTYGYSRLQAYIIASVAVDLRIGQLVDTPNVGVTALLPIDIFVETDRQVPDMEAE